MQYTILLWNKLQSKTLEIKRKESVKILYSLTEWLFLRKFTVNLHFECDITVTWSGEIFIQQLKIYVKKCGDSKNFEEWMKEYPELVKISNYKVKYTEKTPRKWLFSKGNPHPHHVITWAKLQKIIRNTAQQAIKTPEIDEIEIKWRKSE